LADNSLSDNVVDMDNLDKFKTRIWVLAAPRGFIKL